MFSDFGMINEKKAHFFEFFHQRQEVGLEKLSIGLTDDWLRKYFRVKRDKKRERQENC
jgi:hypothetical protein